MNEELARSLDKEWHRFFNGRCKVSVRYCYLFYDAENNIVFEKECSFRDLGDAVRALKKRATSLREAVLLVDLCPRRISLVLLSMYVRFLSSRIMVLE